MKRGCRARQVSVYFGTQALAAALDNDPGFHQDLGERNNERIRFSVKYHCPALCKGAEVLRQDVAETSCDGTWSAQFLRLHHEVFISPARQTEVHPRLASSDPDERD